MRSSLHLWIILLILLIHISGHYCSVFSPKSKVQLQTAVAACLKLSPNGYCSSTAYGPIGKWDVSRITDMNSIFARASSFNADISKWDVSRVKDMGHMFFAAKSFDQDLSRWDVSRVANMDSMFGRAASFKQKLHGTWVHSRAISTSMFAGSPGSISKTPCPQFSPKSREELKSAVDALNSSPKDDGPLGEYSTFAYTLKGSPDRGLYLAITNECRGESLVALRGPGFHSPFAGLPDGFEPSAADITDAIDEYYESEVDIIGMGENDPGVTFAGIGDSLLRSEVLFEAIKEVKARRHGIPIRVLTNGMHGTDVAAQLVENGVKKLSVFVPAADPPTFNKLAQPPTGFDFNTLCSFIVVAAEQGCLVECTTANRPGVDVKAVKDLCLSLGAVNFRERSYHP